MVAFQRALGIAVVSILLAGTPLVEAKSQGTNNQRSNTPADVANAIAHTIDANTLKSRGAPLDFDSATAHDNVVEVRYIANDFAAFDRFKRDSNAVRADLVGYYCDESRAAYLRQGVVIHQTYVRSDSNDRVEFTIDTSSCDTR
ncbi:MAG: hypothetical protein WA837_05010 [Xanthobacteraceae bacterium]